MKFWEIMSVTYHTMKDIASDRCRYKCKNDILLYKINISVHTKSNPSMDKYSPARVKCDMKLLIHSQTSTVKPLKLGNK